MLFADEKKLSRMIHEAVKVGVKEALTVEMTLEKKRDEKTGQPLATSEIIKEKVFLPSFLAQIISQNEGAFRGLQEQVCKESNKINDFDAKLSAIGNVVLQSEQTFKNLAGLSNKIKAIELNDIKLIGVENGKSDH